MLIFALTTLGSLLCRLLRDIPSRHRQSTYIQQHRFYSAPAYDTPAGPVLDLDEPDQLKEILGGGRFPYRG